MAVKKDERMVRSKKIKEKMVKKVITKEDLRVAQKQPNGNANFC